MKRKQYSYNHGGKRLIIIANSTEQIERYFEISKSYVKEWCSECLWDDERKIDLDLTREDAKGGGNENA